jgi:iron complex transport system ATP-binding protein
MTALLKAERLSLTGRLQETSLTLAAGELTCLIGPNGSGKTSLLHALAGIKGPGGTVSIDGVDPHQAAPAQRRRLFSYLPASRDIGWPLTAHDVIALGISSPEEKARIPELLAELELSEFADRRMDRMSTGERSRVLIARALVARPKVLLLDEPAANLDPLWQLRLMDCLRRLATEKEQAMLVAIHDLELARHFADRLLIMARGAITADGDPGRLLAGPEMPRVFGVEMVEGRWKPVT